MNFEPFSKLSLPICLKSRVEAHKVMVDVKRPSIDKTLIEFDQPQAPRVEILEGLCG